MSGRDRLASTGGPDSPGRDPRFGLWRHMKSLWPKYTLLPVAPFLAWAIFWFAQGVFRWEHIALAIVVCGLAYTNAKSKKLFLGLLPVGFVALLYDGMRFVRNVGLTESNVHVCDLREAEMAWFGVTVDGVRMTVHDWFATHWSLALDAVCSIPYAGFIVVILAYTIYLFWKDFPSGQRFAWTFLLLNVAGFITYHLYPAAPPWYFHEHGCAVNLAVNPSEGPNLARVDVLLGFDYFKSFYSRSSDVFGAVPSLHCAYPLAVVLEGWRRHKTLGRVLSVGFYLWMCFSAVYLDHHWVIDVLIGSVYSLGATMIVRALFSKNEEAMNLRGAPRPNLGESQ